jgi:hypothetical protein
MKINIAIVCALFGLLFAAGCGTQCDNAVCFPEFATDPFAVSYEVHYVISFDPNQVERSANADVEGCFAPDGIRNSSGGLNCPSKSQISITNFVPIEEDAAWYGNDGQMLHDTGELDAAGDGGWSATAGQDNAGMLMYGPPYGYPLHAGNYTAGWNLAIDNIYGDDAQQVYLDVYDMTTNTILGANTVTRSQWKNINDYEAFAVPFTITSSTAGHKIEFRCLWWGYANITVEGCGVGVNKQ